MEKNRIKKMLRLSALASSAIFLTACGGSSDGSSEEEINQAPLINIAEFTELNEGDTITLDASASQDSDGSISSFLWSQTSGSEVLIENANTATPTFTFPLLSDDEVMTFSLTVIDNEGAQSTWSQEVTVSTESHIATIDADDILQNNDSIETASVLGESSPTVKSIYPVNDNDFLQINLTANIEYEFFANKLCPTCDVYLYLYDEQGEELSSDDDYLYLDSRILYTPEESGTYYMEIRAYDEEYGVAKYSVGFHPFVDADGDESSTYYDCDDTDDTVYPWAPEIQGDGIDQNCSGFDYLIANVADSFEYDDDIENAVTMVAAKITPEEIQFQSGLQANMRTLHNITDQDFFKIEIAAFSALYLTGLDTNDNFDYELLDATGLPLSDNPDFEINIDDYYYGEIANLSDTTQTIYVQYTSDSVDLDEGVLYIPTYVSVGFDLDGDGFYSQNWDNYRDCDDTNEDINPDADEIQDDDVDSNCNGFDDEYSLLINEESS
jgi:hypothetical protein